MQFLLPSTPLCKVQPNAQDTLHPLWPVVRPVHPDTDKLADVGSAHVAATHTGKSNQAGLKLPLPHVCDPSVPPDNTYPSAQYTSQLPLWFAILMALMWGVVVPIISWRWHRVVDEHESRAYRDGALAAFYVVGLGAPVWWFLWRGGVLPPLQVEWVYGALMATCGIVWMWRKYA